MALHNTQCPHCFTTYVISDDQLRVSEGMVRCGTCRERFHARIINDEAETPRFDPREAFIEPLSEEFKEQKEAASELLNETEPQQFSFADPHTETEKSVDIDEKTIEPKTSSEQSFDADKGQAPQAPIDSSALSADQMLANIRAKQQKAELRNELKEPSQAEEESGYAEDIDKYQSENAISDNTEEDKEALIDEVNALVDDKLISPANTSASETITTDNESNLDLPFQLDQRPTVKSRAWLFVPPLLIVVTVLGTALIYQLWMKQIVVFKDNSFAQEKIQELSVPIAKKLAEHDVVLPVRRNLSQLEIASARTEGHPTRASTTLLRVSVINHAEFEQPLPWLEMSLTDADGRLVSRRNLAPRDYVYQNSTNDLIGARELKKVTIELLSFPKQATGYELKILNK